MSARLSILVSACLLGAIPVSAATFDEQRAAVSSSVETQPETAIISLLKAGIEEGKPTEAVAETNKWLRQNLPKDAMLLYYAGRAAELSGDSKGAVALYQQFLKAGDPKSAEAGHAITAVHALLINILNDPASAYAFGSNGAERLAVNPSHRQLDRWFLDAAIAARDGEAVAVRLLATVKSGIPADQLIALYEKDFLWLLNAVDGYVELPGTAPFTQELYDATKDLAAAITFDENLKLRLDWAVSVKAYNLSLVGGDGTSKIRRKGAGRKKGAKVPVEPGTPVENLAPPIVEATALLAKFPEYAKWVQDGWAGGGNGQYYRNDTAKYWPLEIEAKMAPVVAAAAKLTPLQLADLFRSWREGYYSDRVVRPFEVNVVRDAFHFVRYGDKLTTRNGVLLFGKSWDQLTPEEAQKLAPQLAHVSDIQASLIRAIAASGADKDFSKALAALVGPEAWRLPQHPDQRNAHVFGPLVKYFAANPSEEEKGKWAALGGGLTTVDAKAEDPRAQRIAAFRMLWNDYKSPQPKQPSVHERLVKVLMFTPEAIPELLKDGSTEAQLLARDAIAAGMSGPDPLWVELEAANKVNVTSYAPGILYLAQRHGGASVSELKKRFPQKCLPHPLETAMRKSVEDGLKANKLEAWQVMAWINMQAPEENAEQVKLAQALVKSPLWNTMPFEVRYGAREWFQKDVMTPAQAALVDASDPELASKDLLALRKEPETEEKKKKREQAEPDPDAAAEAAKADVAAALPALQSAIENLRKSPIRIVIPEPALESLATLEPAVFDDAKVQELILVIIDELKAAPPATNFGYRLLEAVIKDPTPQLLHRAAPFLWEHTNRHNHPFIKIKELMQSQIDISPSAASALASTGLDAFARHRGHSYFNRETDVALLKAIRGSAAMKMGLIVIPVAKNDPAYPIYQSQGDWTTGNEDSAWILLDANWEAFVPVHRELSVPYLMWALQRTIFSRNEERQETLAKSLLGWISEAGSPLTATEKANVEIAYGDIAMQRGQLRQAHEIYSRTEKNEAYAELQVRHEATLRRASAERISKNFDAALQTLTELELERVPGLWSAIRYARAEVNFDMEEFDDAADDIDSILVRDPDNADARILLGKVQLKRQKLMEATEVELGSTTGQKSLVPGEKLKVTLSDPTLAVSGAGTEIEVVVWANSGDKESFFLRQFGDQKTKFRGEVPTALGAPTPDDGTLQVIGDDEVFYAYSERFREKMNNIGEKRGGPITVASDAILMASARKLLSETEQRTADMEAIMEEIGSKGGREAEESGRMEGAAKAQIAARSMDANARAEGQGLSESELGRYISNVAKPGNPIHVRVIDPDRSRTPEVDELTVSVGSSSGDSISRVTLKETGTHTGWFEGSVPTAGAQALAFARDSEPGRNPNMVISPSADAYPAWRPVANKELAPEFKVDLNDNVALGEMTITAAEGGAKLKSFALMTGMNERDMTTVAVFPKDQAAIGEPWNPSVVVMNDDDRFHAAGGRSLVEDFSDVVAHLDRGWMTQQFAQGFATNVAGPSGALPEPVLTEVTWKRQNQHAVSSVIYRFRGHFHEKAEVTRRFRLDLGGFTIPKETHPSINHKPQFVLAVDGRRITGEDGQLDGKINLRPGVHHFEIWATGWVNNMGFGKRSVKLQANLDDPETLVDCPDGFFDPATFPEGSMDHRNGPATVTANAAGTEFNVKFGPDSRGRLIKLVLLSQEGPVPALNKLGLMDPDGAKILPVAEDFAELNKNETLEILTGDKISVRYVDDRFVTKTKEKLERFLDVSFTDARVEFADMEPRFSEREGKDMPYYEKLLRFPYDEPLSVAIHDADMDVTVEPDKVKVTLTSEAGGKREFEAIETGDSTGIFRLTVTPVAGAATGNQVQVGEGGTLIASYTDHENNRPGVPVERTAVVDQAAFRLPQFLLSNATVTPLDPGDPEVKIGSGSLVHGFARQAIPDSEGRRLANETIQRRWQIENEMHPTTEAPEGGFAAVFGQLAYLELVAPQLALGTASTITVYAQTDAGRRTAGVADGPGFDISVPGTIELKGGLGLLSGTGAEWREVPLLPAYQGGAPWSSGREAQTDRFRMSVPLVAGMLPEFGVLSEQERKEIEEASKGMRGGAEALDERISGLVVQPGDRVHFGFRYSEKGGAEKWITASSKVITHPVFDIMEEDFRSPMTSAFVGETLNLRVVDLGADVSDAMDAVTVLMQSKSGAQYNVELLESGPHTGIFKGGYQLSYVQAGAAPPAEGGEKYDVRMQGFPVVYGDAVAARYTDGNGVKTQTAMVSISKGADGSIVPFSKKYDDEEIAMRTQFSLAEAYLEMAKRHRKLNQPEAAAIEYESAKQLLSKAMDQFTDPETRAHAEYLLGNLTMEEADETGDAELRETRYRAALSRFLNVTGSYPATLHASKSQYRIATVYESLNEPDIAAQEYVKLAYKYPDSEYLPISMARLGSHFLKKASAYEEQAKPLLAQPEEDKDARFEGEALMRMAVAEYIKTAQIFSRLQERFPGNDLAGQAGLRAGQAYMRADKKTDAVEAFQRVVGEQGYDGPAVRAQAMYWIGMCYLDLRQQMAAYSMFKRLTYDFPESEWAAYSRGQLSQEGLLNLETELELKRLEEGQ